MGRLSLLRLREPSSGALSSPLQVSEASSSRSAASLRRCELGDPSIFGLMRCCKVVEAAIVCVLTREDRDRGDECALDMENEDLCQANLSP